MPALNVLYLHSHDTGRHIQPYGYAVATPKLQRLAEQGVLFRQAFCAGPTCSPSRAALLTGTWPHVNGMIGLAHRGPCRLKDYGQHLANFLRQQGYATALSGTQHEISHADARQLGYDRLLHEPWPKETKRFLQWNELYATRAAEYLAEAATRQQPFFLSCGFNLTHRMGTGVQWHNAEDSPTGDPRYVRPPPPLPDTPATRQDFADFRVAVGHLDRVMGQVLDAVDRAGLADRTLIVCTTDHGSAFPFMKCNLTDHGMGVMLIMRGPGGFTGGQVVDALVSQIDVFPTICRAAGLEVPPWVSGADLQPLVNGQVASVHDAVFSEVTYHAAAEPMRAIRTLRHKYIRRFDRRTRPVLPNCDDSPSKEEMLRCGWADRAPARESLFDLMFDPNEAANVAADPAYAPVLADLRARLARWMKDTGDPLLTGRLEPWPGMMVNPVDAPSPQSTPQVPAAPIITDG